MSLSQCLINTGGSIIFDIKRVCDLRPNSQGTGCLNLGFPTLTTPEVDTRYLKIYLFFFFFCLEKKKKSLLSGFLYQRLDFIGLGWDTSMGFLKVPPENSMEEENGSFQCTCKLARSLRMSKIKTKYKKKWCYKDAVHRVKMQLCDLVEG